MSLFTNVILLDVTSSILPFTSNVEGTTSFTKRITFALEPSYSIEIPSPISITDRVIVFVVSPSYILVVLSTINPCLSPFSVVIATNLLFPFCSKEITVPEITLFVLGCVIDVLLFNTSYVFDTNTAVSALLIAAFGVKLELVSPTIIFNLANKST